MLDQACYDRLFARVHNHFHAFHSTCYARALKCKLSEHGQSCSPEFSMAWGSIWGAERVGGWAGRGRHACCCARRLLKVALALHCHCDWHWHCANSGLFIVNPGSRKLFAHVPHLSIIIDVHCLSILYCTKYRYCLNLDEPTRSNPPSCLSTHKWFIPVPTFYHGSGDINTNHSLFFAGTVFSLVWSFLAVIRACRVLKILSNSVYSVYRYQTR